MGAFRKRQVLVLIECVKLFINLLKVILVILLFVFIDVFFGVFSQALPNKDVLGIALHLHEYSLEE